MGQTAQIRPFVAAAVLRNIKFSPLSYASFIDLQDKLHQNLARRRTLVAVGTHDLSKITPGEVSYEALPPREIKFAPLNKDQAYNAEEMMTLYETDKHLAKFLPIIRDSPVYPLIYSSAREVLSMPPIINSDLTKISLATTDIFIDVTATDETKLGYVLDVLVTMFSEYCAEPFTVEPVRIIYSAASPSGPRTIHTPALLTRPFIARPSYINSCTGLKLSHAAIVELLCKMGHHASVPASPSIHAAFSPINATSENIVDETDIIHVMVPPTRPDILHECDIMEEVAVAYGFNNLTRTFPATSTVAKPFPLNKLSDTMRRLCSEAGWTEVLPLILCSHDENFAFLNRKDPGTLAVVLANPKTIEYQIVRTSLYPGILKTLRENRKHTIPMRVFEVSDVVVKDASLERQARNIRRVAGIFCGRRAEFEVVHGLLDRMMLGLGIKNLGNKENQGASGYYIEPSEDATYFPDRSAKIFYRPPLVAGAHITFAPVASVNLANATAVVASSESNPKAIGVFDTLKEKLSAALPGSPAARDVEIGTLGILHPSVLKAFELDYPCSAMEFDLEPFL